MLHSDRYLKYLHNVNTLFTGIKQDEKEQSEREKRKKHLTKRKKAPVPFHQKLYVV